MTEHTELPWETIKQSEASLGITSKDTFIATASTMHCGLITAEYIVRACNAHEDLLKVAQNAEVWIRGLLQGDPEQIHIDHILQELQAAIANATGE